MRFFYYEPADVTLCNEHMAIALARWFPESAEKCERSDHAYTGHDIDRLVSALRESGELLENHLREIESGDDEDVCQSLH